MNFCGSPMIPEVLRCSSTFHFTQQNGDRPDVENIIILVVPDVTKFTSSGQ